MPIHPGLLGLKGGAKWTPAQAAAKVSKLLALLAKLGDNPAAAKILGQIDALLAKLAALAK